ncbi:SusE domain-containing protein [Flavobacterium pectinovorum]|uniref:SusE outer membrane protein n=1 Tax=Flavobacterium pectinovorum TaxID=29533 RepID=A0AB36P3Z3_9FLAO|nr:SusE domain-containing protein [Flavobacterium pectinovorum]OXB05595.1 hypothetical protein B0A72_06115 [Flavobacterium pectinovorum]SHM02403.1 SusE outer membrane protein [Flavobacterium pectinovorum]
MKNFIYLSIISLLVSACGGGSDDPETPKNEAPTVPTLVAPTDNKLCVDNTVSFQWNASSDANNDAITYRVEVAKDNSFSQIVKTVEVATNNTSITLDKNTAHYWRIKATDSKGLSSIFSSTFKLYTSGEAVVNHLPFAPELVEPSINLVLTTATATLQWKATDVDATDVLSYDVYFGTTNPPTAKVSENTSSTSYAVTLEATKEYFWKVVVKDNKGGETIGQVWKFKTN